MIIAIRISGSVNIQKKVEETLFRMRLRRKYTATILNETKENLKLLQSVRNHIAYGKLSKADLEKLLEKRARITGDKPLPKDKVKATAEKIEKSGLRDSGIKPFFRLHPPVKGIDAKLHVGVKKGVLGDHKLAINKLLEKML